MVMMMMMVVIMAPIIMVFACKTSVCKSVCVCVIQSMYFLYESTVVCESCLYVLACLYVKMPV